MLQELRIGVGGLNCASCVARVERVIVNHPGVESAEVNLASGLALVRFEQTSVPELLEAVRTAGYAPVIESVTLGISQLRHNQTVRFRGRERSLSAYFLASPGVPQRLRLRGGEEIEVRVSSARLYVCAHETKRFVIALTYPGQNEPRYLVASDLSWRTQDILQIATLRWLVEVFLADWKRYEGWGTLAKQPDEEGSSRRLILSLLLDHALLLHPEQTARLKQPAPACTVGSLREACRAEALVAMVRHLLSAEDPVAAVAQWAEHVKAIYALAPSSKHMSGRDLGRQEPTPSLRYRALEAMASA